MVDQRKMCPVKKGDFATEKVISDNPLEIAQAFEAIGLTRLHLVDLDGARRGSPRITIFWRQLRVTQI